MDKFHINMAMVGFHESSEVKIKAGKTIQIGSFLTCLLIPILKMKLKTSNGCMMNLGLKQLAFPSGMHPQIAINDPNIQFMRCALS